VENGCNVVPSAKTGNAHLRRVVMEAAWSYRHRPAIGATLRKRQEGLSEEVKEVAWKAQHRLHKRYGSLVGTGKDKRKVVTAVGRELLGFIWVIGVQVEGNHRTQVAASS
jgi:transposase